MKLTLSQAQERLAHYGDLKIDWTRPASEACRIALASNDLRLRRAEVEAIHEALMGYAAHLAFQEGRDFELDAVKGRLMVAAHEASKQCCEDVLANELTAICDGLHHAESAQRGDVWRIGLMVASDAEVRCVHPETGNLTVAALHGDRRHKVVSAAEFTRNRRLVRRDGKAVTT